MTDATPILTPVPTAKKWYQSKTIWVNVIGLIVLAAQLQFGFIIAPDEQLGILAGINLVMRTVTKVPLG